MTSREAPIIRRLTTPEPPEVMWANAGFSATSSLLLLVGGDPLARWLDVTPVILIAAGLGIALFAAYASWVARHEPLPARHVRIIAMADFGWVLAAAVVIVVPRAMSVAGKVALGLVSLVVLELGVLEWIGQRRLAEVRRDVAVG